MTDVQTQPIYSAGEIPGAGARHRDKKPAHQWRNLAMAHEVAFIRLFPVTLRANGIANAKANPATHRATCGCR